MAVFFQVERERLEQLALDVNQKSRDIQDLCLVGQDEISIWCM